MMNKLMLTSLTEDNMAITQYLNYQIWTKALILPPYSYDILEAEILLHKAYE